MDAKEILRRWTCAVNDLLPRTHGHQSKALAALSYAMVASGRCDSGGVSLALPSAAKPTSVRRRMERLVANPRLIAAKIASQMARQVLAHWSPRPIILILDETPRGKALRCMKISVAYRHRAVPLAWECYRPKHPPEPMPQLLCRLMRRVNRIIPGGSPVTLLADRGLSWPVVADCCRLLNWHYVLRIQGTVRIRTAQESSSKNSSSKNSSSKNRVQSTWLIEQQAKDLAPRIGCRWLGTDVEVYKKAGWRKSNVVATWERRCKEPWLLVTDLFASFQRCAGYCKRTWCEQMHRDEKSGGLNWQRSRVETPAHARRIVLLLALSTLLAVSMGTRVVKQGLRRLFESTRERRLSIFQLGMRWVTASVHRQWNVTLPVTVYLAPP